MALSQRLRNTVYLFIIANQLFGMIVLDLVALYPKFLWQEPSSPLHFLVSFREGYVNFTGDPFFAHPTHDSWFHVFLVIEATVQFPLAIYLVRKFAGSSTTTGATELAALVFGSITGTTASTCCYHLWQLGEDVVSPQQKMFVLYGEYLPFSIIPIVMALDMYLRLLSRVDGGSKPKIQ